MCKIDGIDLFFFGPADFSSTAGFRGQWEGPGIAEQILQTSPLLGLAVGLGVVLAVSVAGIIGSTTPILFLGANIDPAISAGPFVTVTNDIIGITIYLLTTSYIYSTI